MTSSRYESISRPATLVLLVFIAFILWASRKFCILAMSKEC